MKSKRSCTHLLLLPPPSEATVVGRHAGLKKTELHVDVDLTHQGKSREDGEVHEDGVARPKNLQVLHKLSIAKEGDFGHWAMFQIFRIKVNHDKAFQISSGALGFAYSLSERFL